MPAQFTLPPDTRSVGSGNPPADVNALIDAAAASGVTFNLLNAVYGTADPTGVADSTAAFQACLTAATAVGGEMIIPPGTYNLNTAGINFTGPVRVRGLGANANYYHSTVGVAAVTLNCNGNGGATSMFLFPNVGALWGGLEMSGMSIMYTGTGNVFHNVTLADSAFRDMTITVTSAGSQITNVNGGSFLNTTHERCAFITTAPVRSSPMFSIVTAVGAGISNTTWWKCKFSNKGFDATQYMIFISCTGSGAAYHFADNIRECWFESPYGGIYKSMSGSNITVDASICWDIASPPATTVAAASNGGTITGIAAWANPSPGVLTVAAASGTPGYFPTSGTLRVTTSGGTAVVTYTGVTGTTFTGCAFVSGSGTVSTGGAVQLGTGTGAALVLGNSLYYFGAAAGNSGSQGVKVMNCGRNLNGPDATTTWDVYCESTTASVQVEGMYTSPLTTSSRDDIMLNFNGCQDVLLLNNQVQMGSAVNGNSRTSISNPSPTQIQITNGTILGAQLQPPGQFLPADSSWLEWNYDPALIQAASGAVSGTIQAIRINVRYAMSVTNVILYQHAAGITLTAAQNLAGLYTSAGVQVGVTADQSGVWNSGVQVFKTMALTGGPFLIQPGFYWVLALAVGTTPPTWGKMVSSGFSNTTSNPNTGVTAARWATGATAQTTLPASFTPSTLALAGQQFFAGVS